LGKVGSVFEVEGTHFTVLNEQLGYNSIV